MQALFVAAWLAIFLVAVLRVAGVTRQSLRQRASRSWPWAKTTIEGGSVASISGDRRHSSQLTLSYSYSVNGERFGGVYTEYFATESEARGVLKSLQELPPPARYKPDDPSVSVMEPYRDAGLGLGER